MSRQDVVNGDAMALLSFLGTLDIGKAIDSIKYASGLEKVDVGYVNKSAQKGRLLFTSDLKVLDGISEDDEKLANYMMVPLGYVDKNRGFPLCASFINTSFGWDGIFVGTVEKLVDRYIEKSRAVTDEQIDFLTEEYSGYYELVGDGYEAIKEHNKKIKKGLIYLEDDNSLVSDTRVKNKVVQVVKDVDTKAIKDKKDTKVAKDVNELDENVASGVVVEQNIVSNIYDRLLWKENWADNNYSNLKSYIKYLYLKVLLDIRANSEELVGNGYVLNKDKTVVCMNIGLVDRFGSDIYLVIHDIDLEENTNKLYSKKISLLDYKGYLVQLGFNKSDILNMPKPIKFYKNKSELIFDGSIDEFDLDNTNRLIHIIDDRRNRFPECYKDVPADVICTKIKASIINAIKMSERDFKYFVPMYNFDRHCIQYLVPIYLDNYPGDVPELVAIIGKCNEFYLVNTVIGVSEAYNNARLISLPDGAWLRRDK